MIHPIVLGDGTKRLFGSVPRLTLTLIESITFPTGVIVNTYHPAP